jgi:hypothetical protein
MGKPNYLLDHLLDPNYRDPGGSVATTLDPNRLHFQYGRLLGDWRGVARLIVNPMGSGAAWFPDANVAFLDATEPVWQALRWVALGSPSGSTVITGVTEAEMTEWLNDPYRNKERAAIIKGAMESQTWIRSFRIGASHPLNTALHGYTNLLGFRRSLARPLEGGTTLAGTDGTDKSGTMNVIRNRFGPRAQGLAKKGRKDTEQHGAINISDELHCLMVIAYALEERRPSVILTADDDYREIFYKAQWFLDTHYRAWLAANMVKAGRYGEQAGEMQDTEGLFDGPLSLYRRQTAHLREVLPLQAEAVPVVLIYVAPDGWMHTMSFPFELPMLEMLKTRSRTNGRCTDLFGDSNIHVDLGPLKPRLDGLFLGIGRDVVQSFGTNGINSSVSWLDLQHSVCCFERLSV